MKLQGKYNPSLANPIYAKDLIHNSQSHHFTIIDVRKPYDFEDQHISNAINIADFDTLSEMILSNPHTDFLLHCYSGYTVSVYGNYLVEMGAKNVYYFDGTFEEIYTALLQDEEN